MTCTACGTVSPPGRKFCGECGARLAATCPACGATLEPSQKFCGECGAPAAAAGGSGALPGSGGPTAAPEGPVAERRLVSVLFADLVGFTPFSEERDAEEVRETLTRYFEIAREAIDRHGGTVEKFIGDAVMAVWGTPRAREDDAERAVRAALELLDAVRALGHGITARAGVLTGEAAVTLGATDQGMVAGDLVNTAARLQAAAAPGTVLVGEATFRAASAAVAFEEAGEHTMKGKAAPIPAWRALRVVAERGGRGRGELLEAPFTGRDEELRLLKELFHGTTRDRRARLVSLTGPAGIGKSRLAWEFEKYLDGVIEEVWWHHGRSPAYGGGLAFWSLGEMIRARCGLAETADEASTRAHVSDMLARHLSDASERAWVEPAILALLGLETATVSTEDLFARWRLLFERLTATGTVVMVFEDLHWADQGTLDFIDHLLDWSKAIPLLIVTLARPELLVERPDWGAGRRSFVAMPLEALPEPAMRTLLAGLVPSLPETAVRAIVERAEGIPLYAVETVRMLLAEKRLVEDGGVYVPTGDIATLAVPETLTALIAARLDTLDPVDRSLVLDAAVLGQRFTLDGLAAVSGLDGADLEARLKGLVRRELLSLEADPRSPERGQYGFVQALIREVAYHTLARRDRKERHLAAARFFESLGADELAGALAGHYLSAQANAGEGPEADALAAQARVALRGAAERASGLGSWGQAATLLGHALIVSPQPADRADIQERLGLALLPAGRYTEAIAALESARAIQTELGDRRAAARTTRALGDCLVQAKLMDDARRLLEGAVAEYADIAGDPAVLGVKGQLARAYLLLDLGDEAIAMAEEVLAPAEHDGHVALLADTLITKGTALGFVGRTLEGTALTELGTRLADENGLLATRFRGLNNQLVLMGDTEPLRAYRATLEGLELARKVGSVGWARNFVGNFGFQAFRVGEWDIAERELRTALEEDLEAGDAALVLNNLISVVASRGEPVADLMERFERACEGLPPQQVRPLLPDVLAFAAFGEGRYADAAELWREAAGDGLTTGATSLLAAVSMWLIAGDRDRAARDLAAFDDLHLHQQGLVAFRDAMAAALDAMETHAPASIAVMRAARRRLVDLGLHEDAARVAVVAGLVTDAPDPGVTQDLIETREFCLRVGAKPLLELCDQTMARAGADGRPHVAPLAPAIPAAPESTPA